MRITKEIQSITILYLNSVTQGRSGCVRGDTRQVKLLDRQTLPVITGWLTGNFEAAVIGFSENVSVLFLSFVGSDF